MSATQGFVRAGLTAKLAGVCGASPSHRHLEVAQKPNEGRVEGSTASHGVLGHSLDAQAPSRGPPAACVGLTQPVGTNGNKRLGGSS